MTTLSTSNAFAALDNTKKKKKSSKPKEEPGERKKKQAPSKPPQHVSADLEKAVFSQPKINVSNWADTDEEDDDFGDDVGQLQDPWLQVCPALGTHLDKSGPIRAPYCWLACPPARAAW